MTLTSLITLNAVLGAAVVYALHHLLAHGVFSDSTNGHEVAALPSPQPEQIAA